MGTIWALAAKDLRLLCRDKANAFFTFIFPLMLAIFFGSIFGSGGSSSGMKIAAAAEEQTTAAKEFLAELAKADGLQVIAAENRADAERMVRKGDVEAAVILPKGFADSLDTMFSGGGMQIEGLISPSQQAAAGLLTGKLNEVGFKRMSKSFTSGAEMDRMLERSRQQINDAADLDPVRKGIFNTFFNSLSTMTKSQEATIQKQKSEGKDTSENVGFMPVRVTVKELTSDERSPKNTYEISFPQGVVWGLMGCVTAFAVSMANERTRGTLMRLTVSPLSRSQILLGKALACFIACLIVQGMLLAVMTIGFHVKISSPPIMALAMLVSSIGFVGVMMLMAGLSHSEGAAQGAARAVILVLAMIGGGTVPVMFMPDFLKTLSNISPFKWAVLAVEGGLWRQSTLADMALPIGVLLGMGVVGYVLGSLSFRWSDAA